MIDHHVLLEIQMTTEVQDIPETTEVQDIPVYCSDKTETTEVKIFQRYRGSRPR